MKGFFRTIHLYLGLTAGIVISITCFTGACLVFEKELQSFIYPERYDVEPKTALDQVPLSILISKLKEKIPTAAVTSVKVYPEPGRTIEITFTGNAAQQGDEVNKSGAGGGPSSNQAFMDPYSGELITLYSHRNSFFYTMFSLHRWLLMGDAGKVIVGISTSIFLFILITGIVLWWPGKIKKLKQRLKLKLGAGWKRINHDLHITVGFYSALFLFIFAFTGLAWSFQWFNDGIYWITGTENNRRDPPLSVYRDATPVSPDEIFRIAKQNISNAQYYSISFPKDSTSAYAVTILSSDPVHEKATDQYFFDQFTGQPLGTNLFSEKNLGQRTRSMFYPIHVGSIGGLTGRIIAFLACVAGFTFPFTGVILWINRLKKKDRKKLKKKRHSKEKHRTPSAERH